MHRRTEVLAALREAGPAGISGQTLAGRLGVSRVAVGKHVAALRGLGYQVAASPGTGYRLVSAPDAPLPEEVRPLLRSPMWVRLEGGGATGSTNDDAKRLALAGEPHGTAVLASEQTGGRGRFGRPWSSPKGGVYVSAVLRPEVPPVLVPPLALAAALGVARGIETLGVKPVLKWPNDVLLEGGKLAGILLEVSAEADALEWAVLGVGVNVRRPAGGGFGGAAYLEDMGPAPLLAAVAAAVLDGLAEAYESWADSGFAALRAEYEARSALAGRDVTVRDAHGAAIAAGVVTGVDDGGRLLVRSGAQVTPVVAGEVTLRD